jgi:hypothetical protein
MVFKSLNMQINICMMVYQISLVGVSEFLLYLSTIIRLDCIVYFRVVPFYYVLRVMWTCSSKLIGILKFPTPWTAYKGY